jgi:hypothetical protein
VKGGILNGEEGKGRKEEGGEEEVRSPIREKGDALASPFFVRRVRLQADLPQCGPVPDLDTPHDIPRLNLIDDLDAVHDVTEHRVTRVEMRLR